MIGLQMPSHFRRIFLIIILFVVAVIIAVLDVVPDLATGAGAVAIGVVIFVMNNMQLIRDILNNEPHKTTKDDTLTRPRQTPKAYLTELKKRFQDEADNAFIPMSYRVSTRAKAQDNRSTEYDTPWKMYRGNRRFVLVGYPGVGKSMVLKELFTELADAYLEDNREPMPLWIDLSDPNNPIEADKLFEYWCNSEKYNLEQGFKTLLASRPPVLLLDGLNEMPLETRAKRAASLRDWLEANHSPRVIVTCRLRDYEDDEKIRLGPNMPIVHVLPFEKAQIQTFLESEAPDHVERIMRQVEQNDAVFRLAQIPLHLSMLSRLSMWKEGKNRLPTSLKMLYSEYLEERHRYAFERHYVRLHWDKFETKMERLAYKMVTQDREDGSFLSMSEQEVKRAVGKDALTDAYNMHLLEHTRNKGSRGKNKVNVKFFHQSLHGYFALPRLNRALNQTYNRKWMPKLISAFNNPTDIIRQIGDLGDTAEIAVETLIPLLGNEDEKIRITTMNALKDIGIPAVSPLVNVLDSENEYIRKNAEEILGAIGEPCIGPLLLYVMRKSSNEKNIQVARILQKMKNVERRLLEALMNSRANHEDFIGYITEVLGKVRSSRAVQPLSRLLKDDNPQIRGDVVWALGKIGDRVAIEPLVELAKVEKELYVHNYIVNAFCELGKPAVRALFDGLKDSDPKKGRNVEHLLLRMLDNDHEFLAHIHRVLNAPRVDEGFLEQAAEFILTRCR
jgi:hypothetical protein